nr:oxidoreductase [Dactylosporangium thailandense]
MKAWLVTGCSSGLGRALASAAIASGDAVLATARDVGSLETLIARAPGRAFAHRLDVTSPGAARLAVDEALARFGRVDVLANYAGYGLLGALEDLDEHELREQFETNLFGALALTRAVLPSMRAAGTGCIVQMSSLVGVVPGPGGSAYVGSKAALDAMSESLAGEVAPFGIRVLIVEPGGFRTDASGRSMRWAATSPAYHAFIEPARAAFAARHGRQEGDPARAAAAVLAAVDDPGAPLRLPLGADAYAHIDAYLRRRLRDHVEPPDTAFADLPRQDGQ